MPLGLRLAANVSPRELQEIIYFCKGQAVTWNGLNYLLFASQHCRSARVVLVEAAP